MSHLGVLSLGVIWVRALFWLGRKILATTLFPLAVLWGRLNGIAMIYFSKALRNALWSSWGRATSRGFYDLGNFFNLCFLSFPSAVLVPCLLNVLLLLSVTKNLIGVFSFSIFRWPLMTKHVWVGYFWFLSLPLPLWEGGKEAGSRSEHWSALHS